MLRIVSGCGGPEKVALRRQPARRRALAEIGSADFKALVGQHLGDARHAGTADADLANGKKLFMGSSGTGAPKDGRDPNDRPKPKGPSR